MKFCNNCMGSCIHQMDCYEGENALVADVRDGDVLGNFVSSILRNTKPLDSDISKLVDDNFWDLV